VGDAEIALKKWGASKLEEVVARPTWLRVGPSPEIDWRTVTVEFEYAEGFRYSSWTEESAQFNIKIDSPIAGTSIDMIDGPTFAELVAEILAQPITDEDRADA